MADFKQLEPATYSHPRLALWAFYNFLVNTVGWTVKTTSGIWTGTGGSISTGNYVVLESPTGAPFRQQVKLSYVEDSDIVQAHMLIEHAPWVGVAGGWNSGASTFDAPKSGGAKHYMPATNFGSFKATIIANDRVILPVSWWTPAIGANSDVEFIAASSRINVPTPGNVLHQGMAPGVQFAVTNTSSNNKTFVVSSFPDKNAMTVTSYNPVTDEGPGNATITPLEVAYLSYVGRIIPAETEALDARPAALWSGVWTAGFEGAPAGAADLTALGMLAGWHRVHADVGSGYVLLTTGGAQVPATMLGGGHPSILSPSPTSLGTRRMWAADLVFDETVSAVERIEFPGALDGVFMTHASMVKQRLQDSVTLPTGKTATTEYMARGGVAIVWPSSSEMT